MVKLDDGLPSSLRMAGSAVGAQLASMLVRVARQTCGPESEKCPIEILQKNAWPLRSRNVACVMTLAALQ